MDEISKFINKLRKKHGDKVILIEKSLYIDKNIPILFQCSKCLYEYKRKPKDMLRKKTHGCGICFGGVKDTKETFILKATLKKLNLVFVYDLVDYKASNIPVMIKCRLNGHIFKMTPSHHLDGDGCPNCAGRNRNLNDIICISNGKYPKKFDFSKSILVDMKTPMTIICPEGHEFSTTPSYHISDNSKGGCSECAHINTSMRNSYSHEEWIEKANNVHDNYYTYLRTVYTGSGDKVIITCPEHGDFLQDPGSHLSGSGCPTCGIIRSREAKIYSEEDIQDIITELTIQYYNKYKYGKIFRDENGRLIIEVICELHGLFTQRLDHHRNGHGCSHCLNKTQSIVTEYLLTLNLNGEDKWLEWNPKWLINPETGYRYRFDNTLHQQKIISELDGLQHFIDGRWSNSNSDKNRTADIYKMKKAAENEYSGFRLFQPHILENRFDWKGWVDRAINYIKASNKPVWVFPKNKIYTKHIEMCIEQNIQYIIME